MITFEAGKTYNPRNLKDADAITVIERTAKFITTSEGQRFGMKIANGVEFIYPCGRYSMCPVIRADQPCATFVGMTEDGFAHYTGVTL